MLRLRSAAEPWIFGFVLGAAAGFVVLGVGGRIAMRAIALGNGTPTAFTIGGTATVVFLGIVSGVGGGALYALLHRIIRQSRALRSIVYAAATVLLTLRGLRPIQPLALEWFMPLALSYALSVAVVYTRWAGRRNVVSSPTLATDDRYSGGA